MRTVAIVQARMNSTRLPGKALMPLAGQPMLARVMARVRAATEVEEVMVATTASRADLPILKICHDQHWRYYTGSEEDVLDRYYRAALEAAADVIVRVTADCPVIDPGLLDETVAAFHRSQSDYASNVLEPRTYPRGLDVEVLRKKALARAWQEDTNPAWREHVTPYLYRHPEKFKLCRVAGEKDYSEHRWTVDTAQDYELLCRIYDHFGDLPFSWMDILQLVEVHPEWSAINRDVKQKGVP